MPYECLVCEDTKFVAGDGSGLSWREVERRKSMSRNMRFWAENVEKVSCAACGEQAGGKGKPEPTVRRAPWKKPPKRTAQTRGKGL